VIWGFMTWKKGQDEADANAQLFSVPLHSAMNSGAVATAPLLELSREYPSTPAGEHAKVLAAEELFTQGKYPEAEQQFSDFISSYSDSALIPQAKVGIAACLEAEGKSADAITKYHEIVLTYPTETSIVSPAKLTLARLYEDANQPQQALSYYAELARSQNPYDPWSAEARERAQLLLAKHPELMKALNPTPTAAPGAPTGFSLGEPDNKPSTTPAPQGAPAVGNAPKLLTMPGGSSNSPGKP
jgi:tetratricopeptide (TPR) repeat protein